MAAVTAATAVLALGYGVYSGEKQATAQKRALKDQQLAQQRAEALTMSQNRVNRENIKRASQKQPDVAALLAEQQLTRPPRTLLTQQNTFLGT